MASPTRQRNGRTRRERRNADELKSRRLQPCRRCGQRIDYSVPAGSTPDSFNAGHIKNWHDHPELREDPANLQPEHDNCGKSAQRRDGADNGLGLTSTDW